MEYLAFLSNCAYFLSVDARCFERRIYSVMLSDRMSDLATLLLLISASLVSLAGTATQPDVTRHPNWMLLDHENCGNSNAERIIGGKNASLGAYPWIARIGYADSSGESEDKTDGDGKATYRCGGTLINKLYIVTAAHCVSQLPSNYKVAGIRLGEHDTATDPDCEKNFCGEPVQDYEPAEIIVHERYNDPPFKNDIAVIRLREPVRYNDLVSPICMPNDELATKNFLGGTAEVAGWGIYDINDPKPSEILQTLKLPIIEMSRCRTSFRSYADIGDEQLCVGGTVGEDSCGGDSGGSLMKVDSVGGPPKYYFIGVVSFGAKHCGESATPAVYSKISTYLPWILDKVSP